jgi:hypothetical protein
MNIGEYMTVITYILMSATFLALVLIFLLIYHFYGKGREEKA